MTFYTDLRDGYACTCGWSGPFGSEYAWGDLVLCPRSDCRADLEPCKLCRQCNERKATLGLDCEGCHVHEFDDGICMECEASALAEDELEPDFAQSDLDTLAAGNFRRDRGAA